NTATALQKETTMRQQSRRHRTSMCVPAKIFLSGTRRQSVPTELSPCVPTSTILHSLRSIHDDSIATCQTAGYPSWRSVHENSGAAASWPKYLESGESLYRLGRCRPVGTGSHRGKSCRTDPSQGRLHLRLRI